MPWFTRAKKRWKKENLESQRVGNEQHDVQRDDFVRRKLMNTEIKKPFRRPKIGIGESITEEKEHHDLPANTGCHESAAPYWQTLREHVGWTWKARRRICAEMSTSSIILDNVESRASCLARWESLRNSPFLFRGYLS
jgi:hypothetical protein